jgi:hypothetical protein
MAGYIGTQAVSVNTTSATISDDLTVGDDVLLTSDAAVLKIGADADLQLTHSGSVGTITNGTGDLTLDVAGDIILDADGEDIRFKDGGVQTFVFSMGGGSTMATPRGSLTLDVAGDIILDADGGNINFKDAGTSIFHISNDNSGDVHLESQVSDKDVYIRGNDGGSTINAVYFDMSDEGAAIFNSTIKLGTNRGIYVGGTGAANYLEDYEEGVFTVSLALGSGSAALTQDKLFYTKVGRCVTVSGIIRVDSVSSPSGSLGFNVPFACQAPGTGEDNPRATVQTNILENGNNNEVMLEMQEGAVLVNLYKSATASLGDAGNILKANTTLGMNFFYFT